MAQERFNPLHPDKRKTVVQAYLQRYKRAASWVIDAEHVMDAACGLGFGAKVIAEVAGNAVTGIDISQATIAKCKKLHALCGSAAFQVGDMNEPNNLPTDCDALVSLDTIEHLLHPYRFIQWAQGWAQTVVLAWPSKANNNPYHISIIPPERIAEMFASWHCLEWEYTAKEKGYVFAAWRRHDT